MKPFRTHGLLNICLYIIYFPERQEQFLISLYSNKLDFQKHTLSAGKQYTYVLLIDVSPVSHALRNVADGQSPELPERLQ